MMITTTAVALLLTAGCGGADLGGRVASLSGSATTTITANDGGGGDSARTGMSPELEDAMLEFAACMRKHGVDFPDPGGGEGGAIRIGPGNKMNPDDPTFKAAEAECKPILDKAEASMPKPSEKELAEMRDRMLAFAKCMREEGIDFPDPQIGEGGRVEIRGRVGGEQDNAKFEAAQEACSKKTGGMGMRRATKAGR